MEGHITQFIDRVRQGSASMITLIADGNTSVVVDEHIASSSSPHIASLLSSGKKESATRKISMDAFDPLVLKIVVAYMQLGPELFAVGKVAMLGAVLTMQLMEASSMLLMPQLCKDIARRVDEISTPDACFLLSSHRHRETCGPDFEEAWEMARSKALRAVSVDIENQSRLPSFRQLPLSVLEDVIEKVTDEPWPELTDALDASSESSNGFLLRHSDEAGKVGAFVHVCADNQASLRLDGSAVGLFDFEIRAVAPNIASLNPQPPSNSVSSAQQISSIPDLTIQAKSTFVAIGFVFPDFFGTDENLAKYLHQDNPRTLRFAFKARMTKLHRQCFALVRYACPCANQGDCELLDTLGYFAGQGGRLSSILTQYTALSFWLIDKCESFLTLPAAVVEAILADDGLEIKGKEESALSLVVKWAKHATKRQAIPTPRKRLPSKLPQSSLKIAKSKRRSQRSASGDAEPAASVTIQADPILLRNDIERLLQQVRFPYIDLKTLRSQDSPLLCAEEQSLLKAQPGFKALVREAARRQLGREVGGEEGDGAELRAKKRMRGGNMPKLDADGMVELL